MSIDLPTLADITSKIRTDTDILRTLILSQIPVPQIVSGGEPALSAEEIAAGLTHTVFFDGFDDIGTVDLASTYSMAPFKWACPNGGSTAGVSVSNSLLHLTQDATGGSGGGFNLQTMILRGSDAANPAQSPWGGDIVGWGVQGSFAISASFACDPAGAADFPRSWPAVWALSREQLLIAQYQWRNSVCALPAGMTAEHVELDFVEIMPGGAAPPYVDRILCNVNHWHMGKDWQGSFPQCTWASDSIPNYVIDNNLIPTGLDLKAQNVYRTVFLTSADNGGVGSIKRYINGVHYPECDVTWKPGDGSWLSLMEASTFYIILGAGNHDGADFDYVVVRQK